MVKGLGGMMDQWVLAILGSASVFLCLIGLLLVPVYGNTEGDALNALKTTLADPNNVLQSWDPTLVNPCTWFHVTCNSENSVTRVVLHWQPNAGTTANTQTLTEVSQCIESLNGIKKGKWRTTLNFYKPILKEQANALDFPQGFWGISLQEQPNKYYMVIKKKGLVTEAESSIQVIMEKLQSYETRVGLNFEGFQYELGDFWLRVGKVASIHSESLRGIVVEMEYLPISSWVTSHQLMGEFFDMWNEAIGKRSLPGHFVHFEPKFSEYGLSDQYTSEHTAVQYASTIAQMIAATESSQAVGN